jgi:hypothetical protein
MLVANRCLAKISTTLEIAKVAAVNVAASVVAAKAKAIVRNRVTMALASLAKIAVRSRPNRQFRAQPRFPVQIRCPLPVKNPVVCSAGSKAFSAPRLSLVNRPSQVLSPNTASPVKVVPMATGVVVVAVVAGAPAAAIPKAAPAARKVPIPVFKAKVMATLPMVANIARRAKAAVVVVAVVAVVAPAAAVKAARALPVAAIAMTAAAPAFLPPLKAS